MKTSSEAIRLERLKEQLLRSLPPLTEILRGSFFTRSLRCGKPSCHCRSSKSSHRVSYVGISFSKGRTQQMTIPAPLIPKTRQWIANYLRWWKTIEQISSINRRLIQKRLIFKSGE